MKTLRCKQLGQIPVKFTVQGDSQIGQDGADNVHTGGATFTAMHGNASLLENRVSALTIKNSPCGENGPCSMIRTVRGKVTDTMKCRHVGDPELDEFIKVVDNRIQETDLPRGHFHGTY